ncbi:MAG: class I adenylate-forming enzyme family protein, partial [Actinomycetota bacterium]
VRAGLVGPGAPVEVVTETVLGVPMQVFSGLPRSLVELLLTAAERHGERDYLVFPERTVAYGAMPAAAAAVARVLADRYGVAKGDRVAICAANCVEYAITFWATTLLGAVTVAMNGWWTGSEMVYALDLTRPKVLLGDRRRIERLADQATRPHPVVVFEDEFAALEAEGAGAPLPDVAIEEDDPFLILFTSGTTGRPKGALLSHRSNIHFVWTAMAGGFERFARAMAAGRETPIPSGPPVAISASPYFHVSGLNCQLVMATASGMTIVYAPPGKWREDVHLELTQRHGATMWSLVPTQLWRLLEWPDLGDYDLSSLQTVGGGSAVWPPELLRTLEQRIPHARAGLGTGWGMTESSGAGTSLRADASYERPDSIGNVSPTVELEVRDPATGAVLGEGEVGEICIRSAALFLGYWDNPEATAAALDDDRWYRTGDFGHVRDEFVYLEGRRQDLIIRGGENIYPAEIEVRLIEHPEIVEVAVVGVEHATLGQEVKAYVVPRATGVISHEDVREFAAATLAAYKVPAHVEFVDALPHNAAGKVLKHLLGQESESAEATGFIEE